MSGFFPRRQSWRQTSRLLRKRALALLVVLTGTAQSAGPHAHGVAQLDVAVSANRLSIELDTPLDNLLGFEHAPRTDAERAKAAALVARLRDGASLFRIDSAAGCTLAAVDLRSAPLSLGQASPAATEHGDLLARFDFHCTAGARAGHVEVGLFDAFAGLKRLDLQVATPRGQLKATLHRPASRVALVR